MDKYYLVPHFEQMAPRDLYLLAFYKDKLQVSDGLMFWKFVDYKLPLLSYLSKNDQANAIRSMLEYAPECSDTLQAYGQLIDADILDHCWLAGGSWNLQLKRNDSAEDRAVLADFNKLLRSRRRHIADAIHKHRAVDPKLTSSAAIKMAREEVGNQVINGILGRFQGDSGEAEQIEKKLKRRFNEHLKSYVQSEKTADRWLSQKNAKATSYAGYLADIANDIEQNSQLFPIFASPEYGTFLADVRSSQSEFTKTSKESILAGRLGIESLARLPNVGFQGIDEVMDLRQKCEEELTNYNARMHELAKHITAEPLTEDAEREIRSIINTQVLPAVNELKFRTKQAKGEFKPWQLVSTGAYMTGFGVSLACGASLPLLLALGLASIAQLSGVATTYKSARAKQEELRADPKHFGLSIIMDIQKKR